MSEKFVIDDSFGLAALQGELLDIMKFVHRFCEENGINLQTYPNDQLTLKEYNEYVAWYLIYNKINYNIETNLSEFFAKTGYDSPKFVLSGNKELLEKWKREKQMEETKKYRPDLLEEK